MRILIITALYPPAVGGAATYFGDIVPHLAQRPEIQEIVVLTERMAGQPAKSAANKVRLLRWLPTRISLSRRRWLGHAITYVTTQLWFAIQLQALVRRHAIDLIHFHTRYRGRLFYYTLQRSAVPVIADLRDKMTPPAHLIGVAERLLCCAEGVLAFARDGGFPADRSVLIPIPFTPPAIPAPDAITALRQRFALDEQPFLLFVGDITYNKGVYDLLSAFRQWQTTHPGVQLILAGHNREGPRFLQALQQTPNARYLGPVAHADALTLIRDAAIVLLPSRSEGLPRTILEAVALGTKVLCPPGIPEFERHMSGFVLPAIHPAAIAEGLTRVWQTGQPPAYPLAEHRVCRVVDLLLEVYRDVVGG